MQQSIQQPIQQPEWYHDPEGQRAALREQEFKHQLKEGKTPGELEQLENSARTILEKIALGEQVSQFELAYIERYLDQSRDRIQELEAQIEEQHHGILAQKLPGTSRQ